MSGIASAVRPDASDIPYDNSQSGLSATRVQGAIDELDAESIKVVYSEFISSLIGTKVISGIPFQGNSAYLVCWCSNYPANDSGLWVVYATPVAGQIMATPLHEKNCTLSVTDSTITINQTSGNADAGTLYVIALRG